MTPMPSTDVEPVPTPTAAETAPVAAIADFRQALLAVDDRRKELAATGDWESLAWGLDALRAFKADLDILIRDVDVDVARLLPAKRTVADGLGTIERHAVMGSPTWESERLLRHLAMTALVDPDTGELRTSTPMEAAQAVVDIVAACAPITPSLGWRTTALKALGIDPAKWRTRKHVRDTVQITKSN